ncbi:MAG: hypothetical protein ACTSVL_12395 [Promethearchaeota archaeon]
MGSSRGYFKEAYENANNHQYKLAEEKYRRCLKISPNYSMAWNNLG